MNNLGWTTLEQSKKLVEAGLDPNTADMYYYIDELSLIYDDASYSDIVDLFNLDDMDDNLTPCWSLAALLDLLPNNEHIETTISRGSWEIDTVEYLPNTWWCEYEDNKNQTEFNISADNPIDACYEMILKLNELKLL